MATLEKRNRLGGSGAGADSSKETVSHTRSSGVYSRKENAGVEDFHHGGRLKRK